VQELRTYYPQPAQVVVTTPAPQTVIVDQNFVPPMVVTRVEEVRIHPHGGPPGQIKKQLGLQTGAEVVHGEKPENEHGGPPPMMSSSPKVEEHEHGHAEAPVVRQAPPAPQPVPAANQRDKEHGDDKGNKEKEKGKSKEHGKD
jgi:hypothetical protein